jgi:SAM-dependent methyltransferase
MHSKNISKSIGEYKSYEKCRFCSHNFLEVINLGNVPLAGGFLKNNKKQTLKREKFYPLEIYFCPKCYLLQTNNVIDKDTLFKDYFYFSSAIKTLITHFEQNADKVAHLLPDTKKRFVVEIGCNDGALITSLSKKGFKTLGVDPAINIVQPLIKKGLPIINDYFSEKVAQKIVKTHGQADAILSFHAMAHIEDMHDVIRGVKTLLKADGFLAFEVHYLGNLIPEMQYDMIYHEHQYYYSLHALNNFFKMHDMTIFDIQPTPVRSGSMMYFVQKSQTGQREITKNTKSLLLTERKLGLDKTKTYKKFAKEIEKTKKDLTKLLKTLKKSGKKIVGYGASGRGTIIMNYCGLDETYLDYVIDDAPAKQGTYTPGTHLVIKPSTVLQEKDKPDYIVLFAWSFFDEVVKKNIEFLKNGGKFIVPLPKVKVISIADIDHGK